MDELQKGEILIYQTEKGDTKIDVFMEDGTIWLNQKQLSQLYQKGVNTINEHIKHIFEDAELDAESTIRKFRIVQMEGGREVSRDVEYYNLNMILAVGYRVRSSVGVQFRNWASGILTEYMKKGFVLNDDRLKNPKKFGDDYFDELLERIRDIRASEKRFYQKVKDIYSLSVDYNSKLKSTQDFFATVQNKLLYAVTKKTAAELICERADVDKENMGLTNFEGKIVRQSDVLISKNYLKHEEIDELNRIVTMFLDHAEDMAKSQTPMTMNDWDGSLNEFLTFRRREILSGKGSVSHEQMEKKVLQEYSVYHTRQLKAAAKQADETDDFLPLPKEDNHNER